MPAAMGGSAAAMGGSAAAMGGSANAGNATSPESKPSAEQPPGLVPPASTEATTALSPRIRRLSTSEYRATVAAALGFQGGLGVQLVPDTRQAGFTRNAAAIVDPILARQLEQSATQIAEQLPSTPLWQQLSCTAAAPGQACASEFLTMLLPRLYRRPVDASEVAVLVDTVYETASATSDFTTGLKLAVSAALQSASFLYHTELGPIGSNEPDPTLTSHELAASLSYLLTGSPPDEALRAAANSGALLNGSVRGEHARRLLAEASSALQLRGLVKEWLGLDRLSQVGKDQEMFEDFVSLRPNMEAETDRFITEVMNQEGGSLKALLSADYSVLDQSMAQFYGVPLSVDGTRTSLARTKRRGILSHASFLSTYASEVASAPVKRGVVIMKQIACANPGDPNELKLEIPPAPPATTDMTTRERFAAHQTSPACSGCHRRIDGLGNAFEQFDAIGAERTMEHGKPIDTSGVLESGVLPGSGTTPVADSSELVAILADNESVRRCFARNLFRFSAAAHGREIEDQFLTVWSGLDETAQGSVTNLLISYVESDLFSIRTSAGAKP